MRPQPDDEKTSGRRQTRSVRRILKTMLDPDALAILREITISPATAAEVAQRLGLEAQAVRRWMRKLVETGQAVRCGTARPMARIETVYASDLRAGVLDPDELTGLPTRLLEEVDLAVLRVMYREAAEAAASGILKQRPESALIRLVIPVDDDGLRRAVRIHRRLLERSVEEVGRAQERILLSGEAPVAAPIHILFLEYPTERWPLRPYAGGSRRGVDLDRVDIVQQEYADSFAASILNVLMVSPASAGDLAGRLGAPVSKVRYELDRLLAGGLVRVARTRRHRGTLDRVFVSDAAGQLVSNEEAEGSDLRTEPAFGIWLVRTIFREALEAIRVGTPREHGAPVISRIPAVLDASGYDRISALIGDAMSELCDLHKAGLEAQMDGQPVPRIALTGLLLFEQERGRSVPNRPVTEGRRPDR